MIIEAIVGASVRHRTAVLVVTALFALVTAMVGLRLELDALPDITTNQVLVLTRAPGLTPEEVERRVTRPLETALGGLPGLVETRSLSRYGISAITVVFEDEVDPYRARQVVQERINVVVGTLPAGVEPPELGPLSGGLGEIFHVVLSSPHRTLAELLELSQLQIAPRLRSVAGVVEVNSWGGERRSLDVIADPIRLAQRGLTLDALKDALGRATGAVAGASLPNGAGGQALLRAVALPVDPSELGAVMIGREGSGRPIRVADVAEVRRGSPPRIGAATANGQGEVVYLMAQMLRGDNALDVTGRLHALWPELVAQMPPDVRLDVVYDRSVLVGSTLRTVGRNLAEGGALVVLVLFALLGSLRAGLLVAAAIPLSMAGATFGMVLLGVPGNLMSLGALDFGLVVDGAVVVVEQVFHRLAQHAPPADAARPFVQRVSDAAQAVARPMFFSVLIILLVYVPVLTLQGVDGKMFRPMALTVVLALGTSLLLALTFVPATVSFLRASQIPAGEPWLVRAIHRLYLPVLGRACRHPALVACGALALVALGVVLFARAGSELVPQLDEGDLVIQTTRAPDISLEHAVDKAQAMEAALRTLPEVAQVVSRIGSPVVATDIMGLEQADVFVKLHPAARWRPGLTRDGLIAEMQALLEARDPGSEPSFTQPIQMRFNELLGGAVTDVTVAVFGEDLAQLRHLAEQVAAAVRGVPGAADVRVLAPPDVPLLEVRPRPLEASQLGFSQAEILEATQAVRAGVDVGATFDGPVRVPIRLRLATTVGAADFGALSLPAASGGLVPLERLAEVRLSETPSLVSHLAGQRRLVVGFNVRGADLGAVMHDAGARVARAVRLPPGYRLAWGGQFETLAAAKRRLQVVVPLVLVLIVGVLFVTFRRLGPALVILLNVPFACVGGVVALAARGMPISMSAAVGFIALSGIAVLNGVVLIARTLHEEGEGNPPGRAVALAAEARVRPVMMTALVAALGFVPMMLAQGVGAEVQRPLATVVVGGLCSSTLLTLVVLPSIYPWLTRTARRSG